MLGLQSSSEGDQGITLIHYLQQFYDISDNNQSPSSFEPIIDMNSKHGMVQHFIVRFPLINILKTNSGVVMQALRSVILRKSRVMRKVKSKSIPQNERRLAFMKKLQRPSRARQLKLGQRRQALAMFE